MEVEISLSKAKLTNVSPNQEYIEALKVKIRELEHRVLLESSFNIEAELDYTELKLQTRLGDELAFSGAG